LNVIEIDDETLQNLVKVLNRADIKVSEVPAINKIFACFQGVKKKENYLQIHFEGYSKAKKVKHDK